MMSTHLPASRIENAANERVVFGWSGGKDSALALQAVLGDPALEVAALVTTVTDAYDRVSMHGVRCDLLHEQAASLGLPLVEARIPAPASNEAYEAAMRTAFTPFVEHGVRRVVFGDLFLQDVREYRERHSAQLGLGCHFPLWHEDTRRLARRFIAERFRAIVVCVDPKQIDPSFCGREFDDALLTDLPASADPCGERGEFHTFVYDGPIFERPLAVRRGEIVEREGFWFCDLMPASGGA
jgi:uncharacterized protein (TIGR00290 family)